MKNFLCYILRCMNLGCVCEAKNLKFIQVTDVHLSKDNAIYLEQFVNDINQKFKDLDFIVFTGDNIDKANQNDLELFLSIVKRLKLKPYKLSISRLCSSKFIKLFLWSLKINFS